MSKPYLANCKQRYFTYFSYRCSIQKDLVLQDIKAEALFNCRLVIFLCLRNNLSWKNGNIFTC